MQFIYQMLEKSSLRNPNKILIVNRDKHYTFNDINQKADILASFLASQGIQKGERIGIFSSKNAEEIITILAIMKIGCVFVHINPNFKEEQLRHITEDCNISVLFIHQSKAKVFEKAAFRENSFKMLISLSPALKLVHTEKLYYLEKILQNHFVKKSTIAINENDTAAIIYTSGSTGKPKGIIVTHRIFYDSTVISADFLKNNENDILISITPFSFDGSLSQLFTMIYVGGTLVLQESNFPKDVVATMLNEKITGFHAMPSFWKMLLQKHSPFDKYEYPNLRYVSIIGEVFQREDLERLRAVLNKTEFYMMYGTTEAFRSTYLPPEDFPRKMPSIGKAIPGVEISILDENGMLCKTGETGEIVHRGAFVSPGYWNNLDKTLERFRDGALYTGDLGRCDEDGYLYFEGRKDAMLKSMGFRISPEEIESCICKLEEVSEAAAISIYDKEYGSRIKAFVMLAKGKMLTQQDIINHCRVSLPHYMLPAVVEFIDEIPKTATFKINRSELS